MMNKDGKMKYTRKRTGCLTCRARKKRCTEERPVCAVCTRLKLECTWPDPEDSKGKGGRKRRASQAYTDEDEMPLQSGFSIDHHHHHQHGPYGSPMSSTNAYQLPPHATSLDPHPSPYMPVGHLPIMPHQQPVPPIMPAMHHSSLPPIDPSLQQLPLPGQSHISPTDTSPVASVSYPTPYPTVAPPMNGAAPNQNSVNGNTAWDSLLKGVDAASYAQSQQTSPASTLSPVLGAPPQQQRQQQQHQHQHQQVPQSYPNVNGGTNVPTQPPPSQPQRWLGPDSTSPPAQLTPLSSTFFSTILKYPYQQQQQYLTNGDANEKQSSTSNDQQIVPLVDGASLDELFSWQQNASPGGDSPRLFEILNDANQPDDLKQSFASLFDFVRSPSPTAFMPAMSRPLSPAFISTVGNFLNQALTPAPPVQSENALVSSADSEYTKSFLLNHYTQGLARLVSVAADSANLFLILMPYARQHSFLMLSILAWSAANLCAAGPANLSLGEIADKYTAQAVEQLDRAITDGRTEWEVVLGTILMLVQVAICRGDVGTWKSRLKQAAGIIQQHAPYCHDGLGRMLVKNFIYHDILSSSSAKEGSMLDYQAFAASAPAADNNTKPGKGEDDDVQIDVLMGVAEPVFLLIGRVSNLLIKKRQLSRQYGRLEDTELLEFHAEADEIKMALEKERRDLETLLLRRPDLEPHRAFHEAYRLAAELYLNMTLSLPALSMPMLYLTRRLLATVEKIDAQSLPGHCSMHWTIYIMQLNATPLRSSSSLLTDQERAHRANDSFYSKFHFLNVPRSRTVVKAVWERNDNGKTFVEPHDILNEWGWELNWA